MGEMRICSSCKHFREKMIANPFRGDLDAWTPEILEAKTKWDQEQKEIALLEQQRFDGGEVFDYEPNYYPWCAALTKKEGRFVVDPVTGAKTPIYVLCAQGNPEGLCSLFLTRR